MKALTKIKSSLLLAAAMLFAASCDMADFGDKNVDPNNASTPSTAAIFTSSMRSARLLITDNGAIPILWAQQWSEIIYTTNSTYGGLNFDYSSFYTTMTNLDYVIKLNTDDATKLSAQANGSNSNQIAVARILKAYIFHCLTDRWGDIPYSEALKGVEGFRPKFDTQQSIYNALFVELKDAAALLDGGTISGDIILGGSTAKWQKFANSLRLVMALRLSKVDAAKGKAEFVDALSAAGGILASNSDNVVYKYLADANNQNPWYASFTVSGRTDFAISKPMVDYMKPLGDPRLAKFADKSTDLLDYVGMPYGLTTPGIVPSKVSFPNATNVRAQSSPMSFLTYSQILLTQAEAVKLGWITGDAKTFYENAITASMAQWGITDATAINSYIGQTGVAYDDATALTLIGTQKWIALYLQGFEAWTEWRRTGIPALTPAPGARNPEKQIPRRLGYPTTERDLNSDNYKAVVASQGPDTYGTRVWWDKPQ